MLTPEHVVSPLGRDRLRDLVDAFGMVATDRRRQDALRAALMGVQIPDLLQKLNEVEVKMVCDAAGVSGKGRRGALIQRLLEVLPSPVRKRSTFVAIDFETADSWRDSACSIALVRVENGCITARSFHLIRPPRSTFTFTHIHGIRWVDVRRSATFGELWPQLSSFIEGADFLAAHNAPFDRSVLTACCRIYGIEAPDTAFADTVKIARNTWNLRPTKLNNVCDHLNIPLIHHDLGAACAMRARHGVHCRTSGNGRRGAAGDPAGGCAVARPRVGEAGPEAAPVCRA